MADATIQILIEAQDKITAELKNISSKIDKFSSDNKRASENMADAWEKGTKKLIAIGNVAATVDNIFSSLTSLEIRLENATERLAGAQDRLADAQIRVRRSQESLAEITRTYNKLTEYQKKNTEFGIATVKRYEQALQDVTDAQKEEERATRSLIIAENGLKRAQDQVVGTYINIGIQALGLAQTLPALLSSLGPIGIALGAIAVAGGALFLLIKDNQVVQDAFKEVWAQLLVIWEQMKPILDQLLQALLPLVPPIVKMVESMTELFVALWPVIQPALQFIVFIFQQWADVLRDIVNFITFIVSNVSKLASAITAVGGGNKRVAVKGSFATGGTVPETGPYLLHKGEEVIPTSKVNSQGGVQITIGAIYGISPEAISRALKRELGNKIAI